MQARNHLRRIILCALFAALTCLTTAMVSFPAPLVGYIHMGDCLVLCSAFLLGPLYGAAAAGIGSALADIFLSYTVYAPGTLVIKALFALVAVCLARVTGRFLPKTVSLLIGGIAGGVLMALGYFAYEAFALGYGLGAAVNIPLNLVQAAFGIIVSTLLVTLLQKIPHVQNILTNQ